MIGEPPLFDGAVHERLICELETTLADSPVGTPGTPELDDDVGVANDSPDAELVPTEFIADILYVYVVPVERPV